jgi:hypothetical protein
MLQALNTALTAFKTALPESAALFIGHDEGSVACIASVPKVQ